MWPLNSVWVLQKSGCATGGLYSASWNEMNMNTVVLHLCEQCQLANNKRCKSFVIAFTKKLTKGTLSRAGPAMLLCMPPQSKWSLPSCSWSVAFPLLVFPVIVWENVSFFSKPCWTGPCKPPLQEHLFWSGLGIFMWRIQWCPCRHLPVEPAVPRWGDVRNQHLFVADQIAPQPLSSIGVKRTWHLVFLRLIDKHLEHKHYITI